jgi:hypothetical protein
MNAQDRMSQDVRSVIRAADGVFADHTRFGLLTGASFSLRRASARFRSVADRLTPSTCASKRPRISIMSEQVF